MRGINIQRPVWHLVERGRSGARQRCRFQSGTCLDAEDGYTFWDVVPPTHCNFDHYDILYEGPATKVSHPKEHTVIHTATSGDATFALTQTGQSGLCGYTLFHTEHPKLFILNTATGKFKSKTRMSTDNLDLFTYVNAKFIYVEKHIKTQIIQLYKDTVTQKCRLEQQITQNMLSLIQAAPDDVATILAKGPGHLAIQAGEAIHLVKCVPVTVTLRKTRNCFLELPVSYRNQSFFLTPKNRILSPSGTQRDCNDLLPTMYELHGTWYKMLPRPTESMAPTTMGRLTESSWKYVDPSNIATGGIYSSDELETLRNHIMFPVQRNSIINSLAQGATGQQYSIDNVKIHHFFDEETLNRIAESTARRMWNGFLTFGSVSAGIIGIYITLRIIKLVVNTVLNAISLHAAYGWSLRLIAATWSSLTHFCLRIQKTQNSENPQVRECIRPKSPVYAEISVMQETASAPRDAPPATEVREPTVRHLRDSFRQPFPRSYRRPDTPGNSDDFSP
ncbi:uncharacterized protein LOC143176703 isoform X2 [Nomia melanderi]|uniref:uncharacterized protein LOC143176703 isoform X2 n=1 Tax=Nomia melanderi TaxID=2448451 RepID=UPI003FCC7E53